MILSERRGECLGFVSGMTDTFQVLDQLLSLSRSAEREKASACLSEGL